MKSKIIIFEAGNKDGMFSIDKKYYAKGTLKKDRIESFHQDRLKLGKKLGIDGNHIFRPYQKGEYKPDVNYEDGKYIILKEKHMKKEDFFQEKLPADILIISENFKEIAVANPSADCPIIICEDRKKGYTALSHCGGRYINRSLPKDTIKALIEGCNSNVDDIYVTISSCIKKESYVYDKYPKWATKKSVWKDYIVEKDNNYYIDLVGAIIKQLKEMGISHITCSSIDTAKQKDYYSNCMASKGDKTKLGQNFIGFYYK